jgi:Predicted membrane protein
LYIPFKELHGYRITAGISRKHDWSIFAGILYKKFRKPITAVIGEIFGTGILGSLVSVPIANFIMGKSVGAVAFIIPFLISTTGGSIIGYAIIKVLQSKVKTILNSI